VPRGCLSAGEHTPTKNRRIEVRRDGVTAAAARRISHNRRMRSHARFISAGFHGANFCYVR
jgi:hypothetical protein